MREQRTLSLGFRKFQPSNYERLVSISNANYPDYPISVRERRSRDETMAQTKHFLQRFECIDLEQDQIVGFGEVFNLPGMFHPGKFMVNILVDPERQGTGIGRAIYNRLNEELVNLNAILVWAMSKEDLPRRIEFFRRRGFVEKSRSWESRLDLTIADTAKFGGYVEKALKEGIIFTTLAEERLRGQDSLRKIHELVQLITADMPREAAFTPLTFEQWETFSLKKPAADP